MVRMSFQLAHAAAIDAGNASMRKAGRTCWNEQDYNAAVAELERLAPDPYAAPGEGAKAC